MVDHEQVALGREQAVAGLAIGVVHHDVEQRHAAELVRALVPHREEVLRRVELHEALDRARALRPVAQDGRRTVGQPSAPATSYAATSRPASEPSGKSHSGDSPAFGL